MGGNKYYTLKSMVIAAEYMIVIEGIYCNGRTDGLSHSALEFIVVHTFSTLII